MRSMSGSSGVGVGLRVSGEGLPDERLDALRGSVKLEHKMEGLVVLRLERRYG